MDLKLKGKTALVTGGSEGIGKGIARALAREGVDVAMHFAGDPATLAGLLKRGGRLVSLLGYDQNQAANDPQTPPSGDLVGRAQQPPRRQQHDQRCDRDAQHCFRGQWRQKAGCVGQQHNYWGFASTWGAARCAATAWPGRRRSPRCASPGTSP